MSQALANEFLLQCGCSEQRPLPALSAVWSFASRALLCNICPPFCCRFRPGDVGVLSLLAGRGASSKVRLTLPSCSWNFPNRTTVTTFPASPPSAPPHPATSHRAIKGGWHLSAAITLRMIVVILHRPVFLSLCSDSAHLLQASAVSRANDGNVRKLLDGLVLPLLLSLWYLAPCFMLIRRLLVGFAPFNKKPFYACVGL